MQEFAERAHLDVAIEHQVAFGPDKVLPGDGDSFRMTERSNALFGVGWFGCCRGSQANQQNGQCENNRLDDFLPLIATHNSLL
jgi:hypothetical protein